MDKAFRKLLFSMKSVNVDPGDPNQTTIYNFAFGAVYALERAQQLDYQGQSQEEGKGRRRTQEVKVLLADFLKGRSLPSDGEWLAGYFYNDALFRADVCFEHITRYFTNLRGNERINALIVKALLCGFPHDYLMPWWPKIRDEVNALKHKSHEFLEGPGLDYNDAVPHIKKLVQATTWVINHPPGSEGAGRGRRSNNQSRSRV